MAQLYQHWIDSYPHSINTLTTHYEFKQCKTNYNKSPEVLMSTKAVRFSEKEDKKITEFLEINPFLDFSTLARLSIMKFIEQPEIKLNPIKKTENTTRSKIDNVRTH